MWLLTLFLFSGLGFQNLAECQEEPGLPQANICISGILLCMKSRKPITTELFNDIFFEKPEDLEEACKQQNSFINCVENAELSCTAKEGIEVEMLKNRLFLKDLCAKDSKWKAVYLKKAPCINKHVRGASGTCARNSDFIPGTGIERQCRYIDGLVACKTEVLKLKCGESAGELFRRIMLLNGGREFLCSVYKPLATDPIAGAVSLLKNARSAMQYIKSFFINQTDPELQNLVKHPTEKGGIDSILDLDRNPLDQDITMNSDYLNLDLTLGPNNMQSTLEKTRELVVKVNALRDQLLDSFPSDATSTDSPYKCNTLFNVYEIINGERIHNCFGETMVNWQTIKSDPSENVFCTWLYRGQTELFKCAITLKKMEHSQQKSCRQHKDPIFLVLYNNPDNIDNPGKASLTEIAKLQVENVQFLDDSMGEYEVSSPFLKSAFMDFLHTADVHRSGESWKEALEVEKDIVTGTDKADFSLKESDSISGATPELFYDSIEEAAREVPSKDDLSFYASLSYIAKNEYDRQHFHLKASFSLNGDAPDLFYDDAIEDDDRYIPTKDDLAFYASLSHIASKEYERRLEDNPRNDYSWVVSGSDENVEKYESSTEPSLDTQNHDERLRHEFDNPRTTPHIQTPRYIDLKEFQSSESVDSSLKEEYESFTDPLLDTRQDARVSLDLDIPKTTPYTFTTVRHWPFENEDSESPYYPGSGTNDLEILETSTEPQYCEDASSLPQSDCPKTSSSITTVNDHFQNEHSDLSDEFKQSAQRILGTKVKPGVYVDLESIKTVNQFEGLDLEDVPNLSSIVEKINYIIVGQPYLPGNIKRRVTSVKPGTLKGIYHVNPSAKIESAAMAISDASEELENRIGHIYIK